MRLTPVFVVASLFVPSAALADEPASSQAPAASSADETPAEPASDSQRFGRGVAIGYENGLWGPAFAQAIRLRLPLHEHFGVAAKGLMIHDFGTEYRGDAGGRIDLYGCSSIIAGFARLYGGGGMNVTYPFAGPSSKKAAVGGGGYFGFEFFQTQRLSWILEVGGGSGLGTRDAGATVVAGLQGYLGG
jgi:hypothetical protein